MFWIFLFMGIIVLAYVPNPWAKKLTLNHNEWFDYERIVDNYIVSVSKGSNGIARHISLLKNSKEDIESAFRLYVKNLTPSEWKAKESALLSIFIMLDTFVEDELAGKINAFRNQSKGTTQVDEVDHIAFKVKIGTSFTIRSKQFYSFVDER